MTEYKKVEEPKLVKVEKIGQVFEGKFISLEQSSKHSDGFALKYVDTEDVLSVVFINKQAKDLFVNGGITLNQDFKLTFEKEQDNASKTYKYRVFSLMYR